MIETTVEYGNIIHSDKTVAKKTVMKCNNLVEFNNELELAFRLSSKVNTVTADIRKMTIEIVSYTHYTQLIPIDEKTHVFGGMDSAGNAVCADNCHCKIGEEE